MLQPYIGSATALSEISREFSIEEPSVWARIASPISSREHSGRL